MFNHRFTGSVLVAGSSRQLNIEGNPLGRTVIQVDGATVYDKKPFIQKEIIDFNVVPGKPAKVRWHQVSPLKMECDVIVDNQTTTLSTVAKDGSLSKPVGAQARQTFQVRYMGAGSLAFAAFSFWLNYSELSNEGKYYPKLLAGIPMFVLIGLAGLLHPKSNFSPKNKTLVWVTIGASVIVMTFGFTIFTNWFLTTFAAH
jgi:hypothetical protein